MIMRYLFYSRLIGISLSLGPGWGVMACMLRHIQCKTDYIRPNIKVT